MDTELLCITEEAVMTSMVWSTPLRKRKHSSQGQQLAHLNDTAHNIGLLLCNMEGDYLNCETAA